MWPDHLSALSEARFQEKSAREHGVDGFLLEPGDVKEADRGREMGKIARLNAKEKFCANNVIPAYET